MKKVLPVLAISIYLFFILGFILHTSSQPVVFGKYSLLYFFLLLVIVLCIYPFIKLVNFLSYTSCLKVRQKKLKLNPWKKILYLCLIFLLLLFLTESYLRIFGMKVREQPYSLDLANFHLFLQSSLTKENNQENPSLNINNFGFRGDEMKKTKDINTFRIFVLGGSTVLNAGVPYEQSFGKILQAKLQKQYSDKKIEALNAGMDGFTSEHVIIQYLFKIKNFQPDLIITWLGINDLYYSCTGNYFTKDNYQEDYSHQLGSTAVPIKQYFSDKKYPLSIHINLVALDFLRHIFTFNFYSDVNPLFNKTVALKMTDLKLNPYKPVPMKDFPSLKSYKRNLQTLINIIKNDNIPLIIGNQPFLYTKALDTPKIPFQWYMQRNCLKGRVYPDTQSLINGLNLFNITTEEISLQTGINFVDFAKEIPKTKEYFFDDVHETAKGNELTAQVLFEEILKEDFIK